MKRITQKNIGHTIDFLGRDDVKISGKIERVNHGIAVIRYWLNGIDYREEGYIHYIEVNSPRIVEIY